MSDLFNTLNPALPFELPSGSDYASMWDAARGWFDIRLPHGRMFYAKDFFGEKLRSRVVEYLQENDDFDWRSARWEQMAGDQIEGVKFKNVRWKQDWVSLYGKRHALPRLTAWYGDPGKAYKYSGIRSEPNPWNAGLLHLKEKIETAAGVVFNSVLLNWYRDGNDHLGWHADDEPELGENPVIASANFGESRDFVIRQKGDHSQKMTVPLSNGTLLVMGGALQHYWEHAVPKRKKVTGSRFNLTFRNIRPV